MLSAVPTNGLQLVVLGLLVLVVAFLLRRSIVLAKRQRSGLDTAEISRPALSADARAAAEIQRLEVRLHDFDREIESRMQTRIATLDQLIVEADREISRLNELRAHERTAWTTPRHEPVADDVAAPAKQGVDTVANDAQKSTLSAAGVVPLSPERKRMIVYLFQSGYAAGEIASLLGRSEEQIRQIVDAETDRPRVDAA